jgi:hypothetical protein
MPDPESEDESEYSGMFGKDFLDALYLKLQEGMMRGAGTGGTGGGFTGIYLFASLFSCSTTIFLFYLTPPIFFIFFSPILISSHLI